MEFWKRNKWSWIYNTLSLTLENCCDELEFPLDQLITHFNVIFFKWIIVDILTKLILKKNTMNHRYRDELPFTQIFIAVTKVTEPRRDCDEPSFHVPTKTLSLV